MRILKLTLTCQAHSEQLSRNQDYLAGVASGKSKTFHLNSSISVFKIP